MCSTILPPTTLTRSDFSTDFCSHFVDTELEFIYYTIIQALLNFYNLYELEKNPSVSFISISCEISIRFKYPCIKFVDNKPYFCLFFELKDWKKYLEKFDCTFSNGYALSMWFVITLKVTLRKKQRTPKMYRKIWKKNRCMGGLSQ